ncbi:MAG TPA: hypothetical protein PLM91_05175, partial [Bacillota bacterium]|nr:hypothetical protein [Bacillota bacterium]
MKRLDDLANKVMSASSRGPGFTGRTGRHNGVVIHRLPCNDIAYSVFSGDMSRCERAIESLQSKTR